MSKRQTKAPMIICTVLAVLFVGWLFCFSGWIPGKDAAKARGLREKIVAQIPPGTPRADAETFLKRAGIAYTYYSHDDPIFADVIRQTDHSADIPASRVYGFTDSSLDTKLSVVPGSGERVFLRLLFDKNEKMLGYEWYAFAPGF